MGLMLVAKENGAIVHPIADEITFVPNSLVERGRETVMMTLNVKDHLFVDTQIASTVQ